MGSWPRWTSELAGRVCVITGATSGIGLETARILTREDAHCLLVARDERKLREVADEVGGVAFSADVTDPGAAERIGRACQEELGEAQVLVNSAGTSSQRPLEDLHDDEWDEQWRLNVMGPLRLMRELAPAMRSAGFGRIVNVSSSSAKRPSSSNAAYSVGKAAQLSLSRAFADAYAGTGVLINAVTPGPVESPLWMAEGGLADQAAERSSKTREEALDAARSKVPIGRFGTPEEIAAVIVFLCSERASNVTGAAWSVDGGTVPVII